MTAPRNLGGGLPAAAPVAPAVQLPSELMYKGHQIELGSYAVGANWSPRAVVGVKIDGGAWQRTPIYATSSAKFPTRHEADLRALDVAKTWVDTAVARQRPPEF